MCQPNALPHCPDPSPHTGAGHDDVVKISWHWLVVEGKVNEDVCIDCEVDDDTKNIHLEPEVANTDGMADHDVIDCGHEPGSHAGKVSRAQQNLICPVYSRTVLVAKKFHCHV